VASWACTQGGLFDRIRGKLCQERNNDGDTATHPGRRQKFFENLFGVSLFCLCVEKKLRCEYSLSRDAATMMSAPPPRRNNEQQQAFTRQGTILRKNLYEWDRMLRTPRGEDWPTMVGRLNAAMVRS